MADNFHAAGLRVLLAQSWWTHSERAVLQWLLSAAEESAAVYWDAVTARVTGDDLDVIIESIKSRCRYFQLGPIFERLKRDYERKESQRFAEAPDQTVA